MSLSNTLHVTSCNSKKLVLPITATASSFELRGGRGWRHASSGASQCQYGHGGRAAQDSFCVCVCVFVPHLPKANRPFWAFSLLMLLRIGPCLVAPTGERLAYFWVQAGCNLVFPSRSVASCTMPLSSGGFGWEWVNSQKVVNPKRTLGTSHMLDSG